MKKYYLGVDPGATGALGVVNEKGEYVITLDFEDLQDLKLLRSIAFEAEACYLEKVHAMPKQGVVSTFHFGENFGWWQGTLRTLGIPLFLKTPQNWMKTLGIKKASKNDKPSLVLARQKFPTAPLHLQKHNGRSDALMLAYLCWLENNKENDE